MSEYQSVGIIRDAAARAARPSIPAAGGRNCRLKPVMAGLFPAIPARAHCPHKREARDKRGQDEGFAVCSPGKTNRNYAGPASPGVNFSATPFMQ
jgi:hypothetical protein